MGRRFSGQCGADDHRCSGSWRLVDEGGLGLIDFVETGIVHVGKSEPVEALERAVRVE